MLRAEDCLYHITNRGNERENPGRQFEHKDRNDELKMDIRELKKFVSAGESETVEFKKSTGQLRRACETLCGMLNDKGGRVFIGVTSEGRIVGQAISDKTLRDVAEVFQKFEPSAFITQIRVNVTDNKSVLVLKAIPNPESRPYAFDGRPYQRIGSTTSILPQTTYQRLLSERAHSRIRWENQPAEGCEIADMDSEEILRTVRLGIAAGRLPESTGSDIGDILERLGLIPGGRPN